MHISVSSQTCRFTMHEDLSSLHARMGKVEGKVYQSKAVGADRTAGHWSVPQPSRGGLAQPKIDLKADL